MSLLKNIKSFYLKSGVRKISLIYFVLLLILNSIFELITISSVYPYLNILLDQSFRLDMLSNINNFFNTNIKITDSQLILYSTVAYVFLILLSMSARLYTLWYQTSFSQELSHNITIKSLDNVLHQNDDFFINNDKSHLRSLFTVKSIGLANEYLLSLFLLVSNSFTLFILGSFFLLQDAVLTLKIFGCVYFLYLLTSLITKKPLINNGKQLSEANSSLSSNLNIALGNSSEIFLKNKQNFFIKLIKVVDLQIRKSISVIQFLSNFPRIFIESLFLCVLVIIFYFYLEPSVIQNYLPLIAVIILAVQRMTPIVQQIYRCIALINGSRHFVEEFLRIPEPRSIHSNGFVDLKNSIEFKDLSFSYDEDEIFKKVNIKIPCNSILGLIGPSGSGKSTLVKVLMGLHDNYSGQILIDGKDVTQYNRSKIFSYVPQDTLVIDGSILDNVAFGSEVDVDKALKCINLASLHEFASEERLHLPVGEEGKFLSGGQKQRLVIARAIYSSCKVLILDEATSSLDASSQKEVLSTIKSLKTHLTIIIIAHRQEAIDICDEIFSL